MWNDSRGFGRFQGIWTLSTECTITVQVTVYKKHWVCTKPRYPKIVFKVNLHIYGRKEGNVLFNDTLNTLKTGYHGLCYTSRGALAGTRNIFKDEEGRKEGRQRKRKKERKNL